MIEVLTAAELALPIISALIVLVIRNNLACGITSVVASLTSFIASLMVLSEAIEVGPVNIVLVEEWLRLPYIKPVGVSLRLDPLSALISSLVCGLTTLILTYSISYMRDDVRYRDTRRYWFLMLIFMSSMLVVVNSDNFLTMFIGWEGVSLCSYLLIGYYYGDEREYWIGGPPNKAPLHPPTHCSYITFLIVGCSDALMLVGILMLIMLTGSPYYEDLAVINELANNGLPEWMVTLPLVLFLAGPTAKSAQFPLHVWLPYAMAGPTPVSALLHSATMVKAGVYIVLRLLPYLIQISQAFNTTSLIFDALIFSGIVSMIGGALSAVRSVELKRLLAYSTISQIGYMYLVLGVAGLAEMPLIASSATFYHLMNHALFKSALFLAAGISIHATGTLYMNEMKLHLKDFKELFLITLISSMSLIGVPPLLGFWSKEFIIETVVGEGHYILFLATVVGTFLTATYATKMLITTFTTSDGTPSKHHNVDKLMYFPPLLLALTSLLAGFAGYDIKGNIVSLITLVEEIHMTYMDPAFLGTVITATLSGVLLAVLIYEHQLIQVSFYVKFEVRPGRVQDLRKIYAVVKDFIAGPHSGVVKLTAVSNSLFYTTEHLLNLVSGYAWSHFLGWLGRFLRAVGSADMDSFLTTYVITLSILLIYLVSITR